VKKKQAMAIGVVTITPFITIVGAHLVDMAKSFLVPQTTCLKWMAGWIFGDFHPFAIRKDLGFPSSKWNVVIKTFDLHVRCLEKVTKHFDRTPNLNTIPSNSGFMIESKSLPFTQNGWLTIKGSSLDLIPISTDSAVPPIGT